MSIDREKILKQLARVTDQAAVVRNRKVVAARRYTEHTRNRFKKFWRD